MNMGKLTAEHFIHHSKHIYLTYSNMIHLANLKLSCVTVIRHHMKNWINQYTSSSALLCSSFDNYKALCIYALRLHRSCGGIIDENLLFPLCFFCFFLSKIFNPHLLWRSIMIINEHCENEYMNMMV